MFGVVLLQTARFCRSAFGHRRLRSRSHRSARFLGSPLVILSLFSASPLLGQLRPNELVLVYNNSSTDSVELADHYAEVRQVPRNRMLGLPMPLEESINADAYDELAGRIRAFVESLPNGEKARCLVTFHGVPLKVEDRVPTEIEKQRRQALETLREKTRDHLLRLFGQMAKAAGKEPQAAEAEQLDSQELAARYQDLRKQLITRAELLDEKRRAQANQELLAYVEQAEGVPAALSLVRSSVERANSGNASGQRLPVEMSERFDAAEEQSRRVESQLAEIRAEGPMSDRYMQALSLLPRWRGLLGLYRWLDDDITSLTGKDSHAAFDSELSLVLWNAYSAYRSQPNLLNTRVAAKAQWKDPPETLMVARIDAPTAAIARRMIDDAVAVEQTGLTGRCYIDARGLEGTDLYARFDWDLLDLAEMVRSRTKIPVRVDTAEGVFPSGSCEDAALYCGWYSVEKYVPAFRFRPGAVGFHVASFELSSLRSTDKDYWCAGLLKDGVAATLGATSEPYLTAFPRPSRFFGLLLTGRYTLVECFYLSKPFNSWQLALIGDPLYRPFARNPHLTLSDLEAQLTITEP